MLRIRTVAVSTVILAATGTSAHAGGFATARFGGEHGHPTTDNPTAIYYNPAGLALKTGTRAFLEGLFVYRSATYDRPEAAIDTVTDTGVGTPSDAVSANAGEASLSNMLVSPFVGAASDLGVPNLGVGIALYAPFGGQAEWDKNRDWEGSEMYPGAVDGVQRWATIEGAIREVYISGGAAYRLPDHGLSFGIGVNYIRESINTIRARNASGRDDLVRPGGGLIEGRSWVDVSGNTFSLGAGVIWEPIDDMWLGLSYQSQPGFGETTQSGVLTNKLGATQVDESDIDLHQELPDVFRLGARYRASPTLELRFAADYTRWSVFEDQCLTDATNPDANCALDDRGAITDAAEGVIVNIHRDWQDTFGVRGGASYWIRPDIELAGGLSFDSNAVPDENIDASLMDMNKLVATAGGRFALRDNLLLNASYTHVFYFSRTVEARPRNDMGDPMAPPAPSRVPDGAGDYSQWIGLFNFGVELLF